MTAKKKPNKTKASRKKSLLNPRKRAAKRRGRTTVMMNGSEPRIYASSCSVTRFAGGAPPFKGKDDVSLSQNFDGDCFT